MIRIALPELDYPAKLILDPGQRLGEDEYCSVCESNPELRLERTAQGTIIVWPRRARQASRRDSSVQGQLWEWAAGHARGRAFDSGVQFILPTGAALSPDAAWVSNQQLAKVQRQQRQEFYRVAPEFVVEVLSPCDRLPDAIAKMEEWVSGGVPLAWLIDGDRKTVFVYRTGREVEQKSGVDRLPGEGAVAGFQLDFGDIW